MGSGLPSSPRNYRKLVFLSKNVAALRTGTNARFAGRPPHRPLEIPGQSLFSLRTTRLDVSILCTRVGDSERRNEL